jgi:hypothetical protein
MSVLTSIILRFFVIFFSYSMLIPGKYPKLGYRALIFKYFQFLIHYRVVVPSYIAWVIDSVVKQATNKCGVYVAGKVEQCYQANILEYLVYTYWQVKCIFPILKTTVFLDAMPCSLVYTYQHFAETCCIHLQGKREIFLSCKWRQQVPSVHYQLSTKPHRSHPRRP